MRFKDNKELQELILHDRVNNLLTIQEIAQKYTQYSEITYKRFFKQRITQNKTKEIEKKIRQNKKNIYSINAKNSWINSNKKEKHIEHLRKLAISQRGKTPNIDTEGKNRQRENGKRIGSRVQNINNMKLQAELRIKYDFESIKKIIVDSGCEVIGEIPNKADSVVTLRWPDGVIKKCSLKPFMKKGIIPHPKYPIHEQEILSFINSLGIYGVKKRIDGKEIDIFIQSKNIGIEHNGLFWHTEDNKGKFYHRDKTNFFKAKGIQIIHIWEHEWFNRKEQVKNFLRSKLGANQTIYARKCEFKEIDKDTAREFCEKNHIQGFAERTIYSIGCFYNNILISQASFGLHHRNNKEIVLNRFCSSHEYNVVGALSKFSKMASKHYQKDIITWCDLRLSNGQSYIKSGWEIIQETPVDYFYWESGMKIISKQSRQKRIVNTPEGMTESEHAKLDGLFRVWDCGKVKMIFKKKNPEN